MEDYFPARNPEFLARLRAAGANLGGRPGGPVLAGRKTYEGLTRRLHAKACPDVRWPRGRGPLSSTRALGDRIHRQLYHAVECRGKSKSKGQKCDCPGRPGRRHRWTRLGLARLEARFELLAAEVPILSARARFGTRIDLIGRSKRSGRSVVFEIKTGARSRAAFGKAFAAPFADVPCTEANFDFLQVSAELAAAREMGCDAPDDAYVLALPEGELRRLPPWALDWGRQRQLLDALARRF